MKLLHETVSGVRRTSAGGSAAAASVSVKKSMVQKVIVQKSTAQKDIVQKSTAQKDIAQEGESKP